MECNVEYKYLYRHKYHDIDAVVHETGAAINDSETGRSFLFSLTDNGRMQFQGHLLLSAIAFNALVASSQTPFRLQLQLLGFAEISRAGLFTRFNCQVIQS